MNKLLPVGSIIKLYKVEKPFMIASIRGFYVGDNKYTYTGVPYPLGYLEQKYNKYFNQEDIEEIYFIGYLDNEARNYIAHLEKKANSNE